MTRDQDNSRINETMSLDKISSVGIINYTEALFSSTTNFPTHFTEFTVLP